MPPNLLRNVAKSSPLQRSLFFLVQLIISNAFIGIPMKTWNTRVLGFSLIDVAFTNTVNQMTHFMWIVLSQVWQWVVSQAQVPQYFQDFYFLFVTCILSTLCTCGAHILSQSPTPTHTRVFVGAYASLILSVPRSFVKFAILHGDALYLTS